MLPHKYRHLLETIQEPDDPDRTLIRFPMGAAPLRRKLGLPATQDPERERDEVLRLRYRDPQGFALWMAYLAYQQLVPLEGGFVMAGDLYREVRRVAPPWLEPPTPSTPS